MWYLQDLPGNIRPTLEKIVIKADRDHKLSGLGSFYALDAALRYVTDVYPRLGTALCQAVGAGDFAYLRLTPTLDLLRRGCRAALTTELSYTCGPQK